MPRALPLALAATLLAAAPAPATFVTFETGQVRPLALSPDRARLFAVNTPDNRLEIFDVTAGSPVHVGSVPVGLEPVAVAARTNGEVWVVNHLSDSVSIVDVASSPPRVVRTLLVGDEPRDLVFAGPGGTRAFITTAHRGQHRTHPSIAAVPGAGDPQLTTEGVGRADVWVFEATSLGASLGGTPLTIVTLFGDTPRALAATPDGSTVYAAVFHSGNRTTAVSEGLACDGGAGAVPCNVFGSIMPGGLPPPNQSCGGEVQPEVGLVVRFNAAAGQWQDELGRNWNNAVRFDLPDLDVFKINAAAPVPVETAAFASVGTVLFNMAVNPASGKVYVTNGEARNEVRFEGPGSCSTTVRGRLHEARITVIDGSTVTPRHLNKHIDYGVAPSPAGVKERSLSMPVGLAVTSDGGTLYVTAFGSRKLGVLSTAALESDAFVPDASDHIVLSGGGPSGVVLDEPRGRLYAFTRFDNGLSTVDTAARREIAHVRVHNPEPESVVRGRSFLYDAVHTSSNGEASCATCHVFGDFDSLAWDLGDPDGSLLNNPNPIRLAPPLGGVFVDFGALKGPMTTQSLRGMANHGPMHWRGDRTGGNDPGGSALDEDAAFRKFNVAFDGLIGRGGPLPEEHMQAFTDFILQVTYPPNPIRALDNSFTPGQQAGRDFFFGPVSDSLFNCDGCHRLDAAAGFFGSDGFTTFENETQVVKIPHLRNMYQKVGMFGMPAIQFVNQGDNGPLGSQIRGFGFLHDGSIDTLFRFHRATVFNRNLAFNPTGIPAGAAGDPVRRDLEQFMLAFDSNMAPIVGQQTTLTSTNAGVAGPRITLLVARAAAAECDVVAKGTVGGQARGWHRTPAGTFRSDRAAEPLLGDLALRALAALPGQELTYTCVPPGSGERIGVDRDDDGVFDRDELDAGTDPDDAASFPGAPPAVLVATTALRLKDDTTPPVNLAARKLTFRARTKTATPANRVVPPPPGGPGDPTIGGATLRIVNAAAATIDATTVPLPASGWQAIAGGYRFRGTGAVRRVTVKPDLIGVRAGGADLGYSLDEPAQGRVAVRVSLGAGAVWCAEAPAKVAGNPPSPARNDRPGRFVGERGAPPPAGCAP